MVSCSIVKEERCTISSHMSNQSDARITPELELFVVDDLILRDLPTRRSHCFQVHAYPNRSTSEFRDRYYYKFQLESTSILIRLIMMCIP